MSDEAFPSTADEQKSSCNTVLDMFSHEIKQGKVVVIKAWTRDALVMFHKHELDWVYIDADHRYLPCYEDLTGSYEKVKPGGFIMGHDFVKPSDRPEMNVIRAVERFLSEHPDVEFVGKTGEFWSSFVLRKGA